LGNVLQKLDQYEEAIKSYDLAIKLIPNDFEAWSNKGNALYELKRYEDAITHHDRSISLNPNYAEAWSNKGNALYELKHYEGAIEHYKKAISLKSNIKWSLGSLIHAKMIIADWVGFDEILEKFTDWTGKSFQLTDPFRIVSLFDSPALHQAYAQAYAKSLYPQSVIQDPFQRGLNKNRIKIGYYSADFHDHPVSHLILGLLELHNRQEYEIYAFSFGSESADAMREKIKSSVDHFIDVSNKSSKEIAVLSRELEIDIAVDLGGYTKGARTDIFVVHGAAPLQVNFLGYPGTMGSDCYDYIVADPTVIPRGNEQFFNEKIIYLPHTYLVDDSRRIPADIELHRSQFGLPDEKIVFCCFNNSYKFNPEYTKSLVKILMNVPESVLWLSESNSIFRINITNELEGQGINPNRIIFAKRLDSMAEHLARYALADLFLDTSPYNAHSTALDVLKSGLPLLTLMGDSFPSRVSASLLNVLQLPELVTYSRAEFEERAINLASEPGLLKEIKNKLVDSRYNSALFDTARYAKNLESAYRQIFDNYRLGLPAKNITIAE
jgi:predicted O-linked N-acetylglucosamine transferase (SPINDLY family)